MTSKWSALALLVEVAEVEPEVEPVAANAEKKEKPSEPISKDARIFFIGVRENKGIIVSVLPNISKKLVCAKQMLFTI